MSKKVRDKDDPYWGKIILQPIVKELVAKRNVLTLGELAAEIGFPCRDTATDTAMVICLLNLGWQKFRLSSKGKRLKWAYRRGSHVRTPAHVEDLDRIYATPPVLRVEPREFAKFLAWKAEQHINKTD